MQIIITGKGIELTEAIEDYINKKLTKLETFFDGIIRVDVVVGIENHHHTKGEIFMAEAKLEVPGNDVFVKETGTSLYQAIDILRDRLEQDLKKYKTKLDGNVKKNKAIGRGVKEYDQGE
jgi:putative sigma-54 modulation protein